MAVQSIVVRKMAFDIPEVKDFQPLYIAGNSALSYGHTALGLYSAYLEPFFVKSLRKVIDQIKDETLREQADRLWRQEAQHYQKHVEFNTLILAQDYPGLAELLGHIEKDFESYLSDQSDQFRIAYIQGFESYTTQFALQVLVSGLYDHRRTDRAFGELFKWHLLEEVEHRNVAFDVYQHLYGGYFYRARMCRLAQQHMFHFMSDCMNIMSSADEVRLGNKRCRITTKQKIMIMISQLGMQVRSMLPGYTPHKYVVPSKIVALSECFTKQASSSR
ncbi:hypothetical protein MNBD_GAMMA05-2369 [hydrothermal vent metagenome]|uniref:Metal-dependent hydrolase n=1 Tax=hydrothermal vent metagenome TaxID=652676 RepID=A0A3B0W6U5_9ZZZZ